ncbi:MAG: hypothetical protein L6Q92_15700 [Phycisphaerae bacterium]|nr:hypothetical protein [Phycisphaerae bacterium]
MLESTADFDRRSTERVCVSGRIEWKRAGDDGLRRGWLSDRATDSLSFIVGTDVRPSLDDVIEIVHVDRPPENLRVTRIAPYDDHLSVVAGRLVVTMPVPPVIDRVHRPRYSIVSELNP